MTEEVLPRASVAGPVGGYEYQWLVSWHCALDLLAENGNDIEISVEKPQVDLVDDVVIRRRNGPGVYYQVKFSVDANNPIDEDFWTKKKDTGQSFLQRLSDVFDDLQKNHPRPELVLYTNRPMDPSHPILKFRDGRTGRLGQALRRELPVTTLRRRKAWADHIGKTEEELCKLLDHVRLEFDQRSEKEFERSVADRMASYNLTRDVRAGKSIVRSWVQDGVRSVDRARFLAEIESEKLWSGVPSALLVVQAIDYHLDAPRADASVNWVDLFEGDSAKTRRQLKNPSLWNERLYPELANACRQIEATRKPRILVRGHGRLSTAFVTGQLLPGTRGFQLEWEQHGIPWRSVTKPAVVEIPQAKVEPYASGDDLAVGINVIHDRFDEDVRKYLTDSQLPIRGFLPLRSPVIGNKSIPDDAYALGFVQWVLRSIVAEVRAHKTPKVHLFMAAPLPVALFLGHLSNLLPDVQLYEDQNPGYAPTFLVRA